MPFYSVFPLLSCSADFGDYKRSEDHHIDNNEPEDEPAAVQLTGYVYRNAPQ